MVPVAVPDIGELGGETHHTGALGADQDWRTTLRGARSTRQVIGVVCLVILPLEIRVSVAQEWRDDVDCILEPADAMIKRQSEHIEIGLMPAGAEAEDQAAITDLIDHFGRLGDDARIAEQHAGDEDSEGDALRRGGDPGESRPPLPDAAKLLHVVVAYDEMIGEPGAVKSE